jgi:hypothetical protein
MRISDISKAANPLAKWILLVYLVSFFLPVTGSFRPGCLLGIQLFLIGAFYSWMPLFGFLINPWYANVFLLVGIRLLRKHRYDGAAACGLIALGLGLSFVLFFVGPEARADLGIGYYVWVLSMAMLALAGRGARGEQFVEHKAGRLLFDARRFRLNASPMGKAHILSLPHESEVPNECESLCHETGHGMDTRYTSPGSSRLVFRIARQHQHACRRAGP